jgi:hypothetical protein
MHSVYHYFINLHNHSRLYLYYKMKDKLLKIMIFALLITLVISLNTFCSTMCTTSCNGGTFNDCDGKCLANWIPTCGSGGTFYGPYSKSETVVVDFTDGISKPFYQFIAYVEIMGIDTWK